MHLLFESEEQVIELMIEKEFSDVPIMVDVARKESGLNPYAYNPEWHKGCRGSYGIFQIACVNYKGNPEDLFDIRLNIEIAREVYESQSLNAWGVCGKLVDCKLK